MGQCHPLDPAIHFSAGLMAAAVILVFALVVIDHLFPAGRPRKRK